MVIIFQINKESWICLLANLSKSERSRNSFSNVSFFNSLKLLNNSNQTMSRKSLHFLFKHDSIDFRRIPSRIVLHNGLIRLNPLALVFNLHRNIFETSWVFPILHLLFNGSFSLFLSLFRLVFSQFDHSFDLWLLLFHQLLHFHHKLQSIFVQISLKSFVWISYSNRLFDNAVCFTIGIFQINTCLNPLIRFKLIFEYDVEILELERITS